MPSFIEEHVTNQTYLSTNAFTKAEDGSYIQIYGATDLQNISFTRLLEGKYPKDDHEIMISPNYVKRMSEKMNCSSFFLIDEIHF